LGELYQKTKEKKKEKGRTLLFDRAVGGITAGSYTFIHVKSIWCPVLYGLSLLRYCVGIIRLITNRLRTTDAG
jgi:hypothetical protein